MAKSQKTSLTPEQEAYYNEQEAKLKKSIDQANSQMGWIVFICLVPPGIIGFLIHDMTIAMITGAIGAVGVIAIAIGANNASKKLEALQKERAFPKNQK